MAQIYYTKEDLQLKIEAMREARALLDNEIDIMVLTWSSLDRSPEGAVCDKKLRILKEKPKKIPYYQVEKAVREAKEHTRKKVLRHLGIKEKVWG